LYLDLVEDIIGFIINGKFNNGLFFSRKFPQKIKLIESQRVCIFDENLRKVSIYFKIRGSMSVILVNFKGDECNLP